MFPILPLTIPGTERENKSTEVENLRGDLPIIYVFAVIAPQERYEGLSRAAGPTCLSDAFFGFSRLLAIFQPGFSAKTFQNRSRRKQQVQHVSVAHQTRVLAEPTNQPCFTWRINVNGEQKVVELSFHSLSFSFIILPDVPKSA